MTELQKLARECRGYLTMNERLDGSGYISRTDDAPDWFKDLCREAHKDGTDIMLPDDWRYRFIRDALDLLADGAEAGNAAACIEASPYLHDLTEWLGSHSWRMHYCDEAADTWELEPESDIYRRLAAGQEWERLQVLEIVEGILNERLENAA